MRPDEANEREAELCRLMTAYLEGHLDAFDALYSAVAPRLRSYLRGQCRDAALADDLVQETFLQMHRSRRTYQPGRPVSPWVFAIARHVYLMNRRANARRLRFQETLAADVRSGDVPHDDAKTLMEQDTLQRALAAVPAEQRRALEMHHVEGWSFAEIAARLGIRVNAAKTRAFRGMRKLKEQLKP